MIARVPSPTISTHKYANEQMMGKSCSEIAGYFSMHRATHKAKLNGGATEISLRSAKLRIKISDFILNKSQEYYSFKTICSLSSGI